MADSVIGEGQCACEDIDDVDDEEQGDRHRAPVGKNSLRGSRA